VITLPTASAQVVINNPLGLHARPAMAFVDAANGFESRVRVKKDGQAVDGKSIMQLMMLAAVQGTPLEVEADGPDAEAAVAELSQMLNQATEPA
jgi:phosphocarrier protein